MNLKRQITNKIGATVIAFVGVIIAVLFFMSQQPKLQDTHTSSPVPEATTTVPSFIQDNPAPTSSKSTFALPARFSPVTRKYFNDELNFSFEYPSDISVMADRDARVGTSSVALHFSYQKRSLITIVFDSNDLSVVTSSGWSYDSGKASYVFRPYWAKRDTPCPTSFFGNAKLPTAVTSFGDGGWFETTYHMLLDSRAFTVETYDSSVEFDYRFASQEEKAAALRDKQIVDELQARVLRSLSFGTEKARNFICQPRES